MKIILIISFTIFMFINFSVFSQNKRILTENEAFEILKKKVAWSNEPYIRMIRTIVGKNNEIKTMLKEKKLIYSDFDAYVFFFDDEPMAGWAHPCRYVFVNIYTGDIQITEATSPPYLEDGNEGEYWKTKSNDSCTIKSNILNNYQKISKDEALKILEKNVSHTYQFYMYPFVMDRKIKIRLVFQPKFIRSADFVSYVFFIDDTPYASWAHPCRYIFINVYNGKIEIKEATSLPIGIENWEEIIF